MLTHTTHNGYLIDGFPREAKQGVMFEETVNYVNFVFLEKLEKLWENTKNFREISGNFRTVLKKLLEKLMNFKKIKIKLWNNFRKF